MGPLAFALVNNPPLLAPLTILLPQILFMKMMVVMKTTFFTMCWFGKGKHKRDLGVELMIVTLR